MNQKTQFRPAAPFKRVDGLIQMALTDGNGDLANILPMPRPKPMTLTPEAMVIGSALNAFGSASSMEMLMNSFEDKFLVEHLFNFCALYPDFTSLGMVLQPQYGYLIADIDNQPVLAWWITNTNLLNLSVEVGQYPRSKGVFKDLSAAEKILPSELIYALSICAANAGIGSDQFVINRDPEFVTVMWNDVEQSDFFVGANFPRQES